jgi:hypothetical protein
MRLADGESRSSQAFMEDGSSGCVAGYVVVVAGWSSIKSAGPLELRLTDGRWPEFAAL